MRSIAQFSYWYDWDCKFKTLETHSKMIVRVNSEFSTVGQKIFSDSHDIKGNKCISHWEQNLSLWRILHSRVWLFIGSNLTMMEANFEKSVWCVLVLLDTIENLGHICSCLREAAVLTVCKTLCKTITCQYAIHNHHPCTCLKHSVPLTLTGRHFK